MTGDSWAHCPSCAWRFRPAYTDRTCPVCATPVVAGDQEAPLLERTSLWIRAGDNRITLNATLFAAFGCVSFILVLRAYAGT